MEIRAASEADYVAILRIWENSVRATHDFLKEEDLQLYKRLIPTEYLPQLKVYVIDDDGQPAAFFAVSDDNLEMLFVDSAYRGKGFGTVALQHVLDKLQVYKVDVNEQNQQAVNFYLKKGYQLMGRSAVDGMGKPYPILHLHHESTINGLK
ncbi:GNAT family N-acetyltransferase [uncultured Sphingobacterium sp.]|uniref:GNAT family N-acetyltransferase n=1 Tax=uncultured Sphingobacterium sp. TaxID=182688 RepID=UPI0025D25ECD|nr:GNAT family N-acetyltransferase [uncultured Sphingobacterium sp.]